MAANSVKHVSKEAENLLNDLQNLLKKQIKLAHKGDIIGVESLSRQANSLVEKNMQSGILEQADLKNQREKLQKLYEQLSLIISAQIAKTEEQINRIRKGKKLIGGYRKNISL